MAKLFEDDLTLDNLSRPQLVSICRYMGVQAFGTDQYLKYQIRNRIEHIKKDDRVRQGSSIRTCISIETSLTIFSSTVDSSGGR